MIVKTIPILLAAAAALLLAAAAGPLAGAQPPSPLALPEGATGRLIVPRSRDVWQVAANSGVEERLLAGAPLTTVTQVSWAPDGRRVAYSLFRFWSAERPAGSDLYTVDAGNGERTMVLGAIGEDASFTEPVWTPDGASLVYTAVLRDSSSRFGDTTSQIERMPLTGGPRAVLVDNGFSPALSRDGRHLAFLRE